MNDYYILRLSFNGVVAREYRHTSRREALATLDELCAVYYTTDAVIELHIAGHSLHAITKVVEVANDITIL
jgi:hypothetical protein